MLRAGAQSLDLEWAVHFPFAGDLLRTTSGDWLSTACSSPRYVTVVSVPLVCFSVRSATDGFEGLAALAALAAATLALAVTSASDTRPSTGGTIASAGPSRSEELAADRLHARASIAALEKGPLLTVFGN